MPSKGRTYPGPPAYQSVVPSTHTPPVRDPLHHLWSLVKVNPGQGLTVLHLGPAFSSPSATLSSLLTGLVAPSVPLSFLGGSLLLLLLVDAICLPRPGALASISPASTPLSSLRVCPLSESCESVEAAGSGGQKESGDLYSWGQGGLPGGGDKAADRKRGTPRAKTKGVGGKLEGRETFPTLPPTETCPSNVAWHQGHHFQDVCLDCLSVMIKTEIRKQT